MLYQSIPFAVIFAILVIAALRYRKVSALSIFTLGVIAFNFFCAIFLHLRPRSGRPFSDLSAMIFLGVTYGLLCLPLLWMKKKSEDFNNGNSSPVELSPKVFLSLSIVLVGLTVPVSLFDFVYGCKWLWLFSTTDVTRDTLRQAQAAGGKSLLQNLGFMLDSFSFCALFLSAVGMVWFHKFRVINMLLMLGGLAPVFWSYSQVARSVAMHEALFYVLAILLAASMRPKEAYSRRRIFLNPTFILFAFFVTFPFVLITTLRFVPAFAPSAYKKSVPVATKQTAPSAKQTVPKVITNTQEVVYRGSNKEGVFYSSYSYFCTGAYSFNADYVARYEKGFPCFRGALTVGPVVKIMDVLTGSRITKDAQELFTRLHLAPRDEFPRSIYRDISGAYSGEFKTMIGNVIYDYPRWGAILFCAMVSIGALLVFARMKAGSLAYKLFATLYVDTLLFGLMLWPWRSVRQGLIMVWLLVFVAFLFVLGKKGRMRAQ